MAENRGFVSCFFFCLAYRGRLLMGQAGRGRVYLSFWIGHVQSLEIPRNRREASLLCFSFVFGIHGRHPSCASSHRGATYCPGFSNDASSHVFMHRSSLHLH